MKRSIVITENYGGMAPDSKQGPENSFASSRHIDFRKSPTTLSVLPKAEKETGSIVLDLVLDIIQLPSGKKIAVGDQGYVYTRDVTGEWRREAEQLQDFTGGLVYNFQHDTVYCSGKTSLHSINHADSRFGATLEVNSNSISYLADQFATDSTNTYTTPATITESATHTLSFTPTLEPLNSVDLWVTTKGTGALTLTLHDGLHNVLGTKTVEVADITNGAMNNFRFDDQIRTTAKPTASIYHLHVTYDNSGGKTASTIGCATASDFSTARFTTYADRLAETANGLHPMASFMYYIIVGNGRYVCAWEPITQYAPSALEFNQHRLVLPTGYEVTSMANYTEYIAFACEKTSTSMSNEFQDGKIIFWDGTSSTYNFTIDVPEGSPYSLFSHKNILYWFANGGWWAWSGGNPVKIYQMPGTDFEYTDTKTFMFNYPNSMTVRNGILLGAFPGLTNSTALEHLIYSYGSRNKNYPESFGESYTMSTGSTQNGTLRLGCLRSFGDTLFISWQDDTNYGVDVVSPYSDPAATAYWESLIIDNGRPDRTKQASEMYITFNQLPAGSTVTPRYKIDRAATWTTGTAAVAGDTKVILNINKRYNEIQLGFDVTTTTTTPEITSVVFILDTLGSERD